MRPLILILIASIGLSASATALESPGAYGNVLLPDAATLPAGTWKLSGHLIGASLSTAPVEGLEVSLVLGGQPSVKGEERDKAGAMAAVKWRWLEHKRWQLATLGVLEGHGRPEAHTVSIHDLKSNTGIAQLATVCLTESCSNQVTGSLGLASPSNDWDPHAHAALAMSLRFFKHVRASVEVHLLRPLSSTLRPPGAVSLPWGSHAAAGFGIYGASWSLDVGVIASALAIDDTAVTPLLSYSWWWR